MCHSEIIESIKFKLSSRERLCLLGIDSKDSDLILSAVLLVLFYKDKELFVLFTKRSELVEYHKGEISFPGGAIESSDKDIRDCALRETYEEIGIEPKDVKVLGLLDDIKTLASPFVVTPIVGFINYPYDFYVNRMEVDELISVSLRTFLYSTVEATGQNNNKAYFNYNEHVIWGATGIILRQFLDIVFDFSKPKNSFC